MQPLSHMSTSIEMRAGSLRFCGAALASFLLIFQLLWENCVSLTGWSPSKASARSRYTSLGSRRIFPPQKYFSMDVFFPDYFRDGLAGCVHNAVRRELAYGARGARPGGGRDELCGRGHSPLHPKVQADPSERLQPPPPTARLNQPAKPPAKVI
jgi:hypothetical protein